MLKIEHINITFQRPVITDSTLTLYPNEITLLSGESGSGKTSLLHIIGLLDEDSSYSYILDGKTIQRNEYEHLKRSMISYVFQDYNLLEDFSVLDNFKTMFNIAGLTYSKDKVLSLLKLVSIDETKLKQKSKSLSGGEKQRLAIALALVKEPSILILDEPTANLDEENIKGIVSILHRLKEEGYMIVVASHHAHLYHADRIYHIQDTKLIEEGTQREEVRNREVNETRKKFNIFSYSFNHVTRHFLIYTLVIIALIFSSKNFLSNGFDVGVSFQSMNKSIQKITEEEIFITNTETSSDVFTKDLGTLIGFYEPKGLRFSQSYFDQIKAIEHVNTVYNYNKASNNTFVSSFDLEGNEVNDDTKFNEVTVNSSTKSTPEPLNTATTHAETMLNRCYLIDDEVENGVFISKEIADLLDIKELNHTKITFTRFIIIGYFNSEYFDFLPDGTPKSTSTIYQESIAIAEPVTYEIKGIADYKTNTTSAPYDGLGNFTIFLDYKEYEKAQKQYLENQELQDKINESIIASNLTESQGLDPDCQFGVFPSSSLLVEADGAHIEEVTQAIKDIDPTRYVLSPEDTKTSTIYSNLYYIKAIFLQPIIILLAILLLLGFLFFTTLKFRRKEISLLKANGITSLTQLLLCDYLYCFIVSILFVSVWLTPVIQEKISLLSPSVSISFPLAFLFLCGLALITLCLLLLLCYIIQKQYVKRIDVKKELRSK